MKIRDARLLGLVLGAGMLGAGISCGFAQTGTAPTAATTPSVTPAPAKKPAKRRRSANSNGQLQRIPIEQTPPSPSRPDETAAQRVADQKLLQQQQAQSAQSAQITDQQVKTAQQRIDKIQDEQRIQDAPGPSQTGLVPAAGPPLAPAPGGTGASGGPAMQDAPGPAQTAAPPTAPVQPPPLCG